MTSGDRVSGSIRRGLATLCSAVVCIAAVGAPTASALNPQPLPPGHSIGIQLPPDPCSVAIAGRC
jgi:hypothetical protein